MPDHRYCSPRAISRVYFQFKTQETVPYNVQLRKVTLSRVQHGFHRRNIARRSYTWRQRSATKLATFAFDDGNIRHFLNDNQRGHRQNI